MRLIHSPRLATNRFLLQRANMPLALAPSSSRATGSKVQAKPTQRVKLTEDQSAISRCSYRRFRPSRPCQHQSNRFQGRRVEKSSQEFEDRVRKISYLTCLNCLCRSFLLRERSSVRLAHRTKINCPCCSFNFKRMEMRRFGSTRAAISSQDLSQIAARLSVIASQVRPR